MFTIECEINKGGFGRVERVRLDNGTLAARKVYSPAYSYSAEEEEKLKKRFKREVKVQETLDSQSFIPILGYNLDSNDLWFLMPLAEKNLFEEISITHQTGLAPQKALADILNGLDELHQLGFVHRDLKPQNVLFYDGVWRLTDFGLVLPPSGTTTKLTSIDSNWGTAAYCAPEQAIDFRSASLAADIYAFGCILHDIYANTLRIPYQRYSASGPIGAIIEKCTEIKPEKRFKNVQALRSALLTLLATTADVKLSPKVTEFVESISDIKNWPYEKLESLVRFVSHCDNYNDQYAIFTATDEEILGVILSIDNDLWKTIALSYCEWATTSSFGFDYCDVVIRRLQLIFDSGDYECKASSALAAAELGRSHNRWFVMQILCDMCGSHLDDSVAHRIAIEIKVQEAEYNFQRCAKMIHKNVDIYHPRITAVLQ